MDWPWERTGSVLTQDDCLGSTRSAESAGADDEPVIEITQAVYDLLACAKKLIIVHGATHLFEEPDTLEQVVSAIRKNGVKLAGSEQRRSPTL